MTKAQSRILRNIINHCKYASSGMYTEMDKRKWKSYFILVAKKKLEMCGYTDQSITVSPV